MVKSYSVTVSVFCLVLDIPFKRSELSCDTLVLVYVHSRHVVI